MIEVAKVEDVPRLSEATVQRALDDVDAEIARQDALARRGKFGGTHILPSGPDHARLAVLVEEVGEVARELNEALIRGQNDLDHLRTELIQVGACAVAWAAALAEGRD